MHVGARGGGHVKGGEGGTEGGVGGAGGHIKIAPDDEWLA
jgi:hypothetical protein